VFGFLPYPFDHPAQLFPWSDRLLDVAHLPFERFDTLEQLIDLDSATPGHREILSVFFSKRTTRLKRQRPKMTKTVHAVRRGYSLELLEPLDVPAG
jgi:hypothetical protein